MKSKPPLESAVQSACIDWCQAHGIFVQRRNTGAVAMAYTRKDGSVKKRFVRYSSPGQADLWGILPGGRHFECEVKREGEEPTEIQLAWLANCARAGAYAFWCDSLDDFIGCMEGKR